MSLKVWIVDDDEEMITAMQMMLRLLKAETSGYLNARQAANALLEGKRPDVILLDISMPEVSGMDLLKYLRRGRDLSHIPVIMFTSEASDTMVDKSLAMGADAYLTKPVSFEELKTAIARAMTARGGKENG
jgi:CheY-like chemotaxis protein